MINASLLKNAASQLALQADIVGKLAQDPGAFAATFAAFDSNDPQAFAWMLQKLALQEHCELICEWIRVKRCVLRCFEVCGFPDPKIPTPELPEFADALLRLASDPATLRRVVDAVSCGDAENFSAALTAAKLQNFCHLICRYICSLLYRRLCEIVCTGRPVAATDVALEIRADAEALKTLLEHKDALAAIAKAADSFDDGAVRAAIDRGGLVRFCEIICRLICVWRCVRVCRTLCVERPPILTGALAVEEARGFALAARALAAHPRALGELVEAVAVGNAEAYVAIVERFGLGLYCWQICGWICSELCYEFCVIVCPPPPHQPLWTNIGKFVVQTDIDASGKTKYAKLGAGGVDYAFFSALDLKGWCPENSPLSGGGQMMYRFKYSAGSVSDQPLLDGNLHPVQVGFDQVNWPTADASGKATAALVTTNRPIYVLNRSDIAGMPNPPPSPPPASGPWAPPPPALGAPWYAAAVYIWPDPNGWVQVFPSVWAGGVEIFMSFDTRTVVIPADPNPAYPPAQIGAVPPPAASQLNGTSVTLTFEATRVSHPVAPDFSQSPSTIRVNNATEVNQLTFQQFFGPQDGCTPISSALTVLYTADHEELGAGNWSLSIISASPSAPGVITPASTARGGSGSVAENTSAWEPCSYTARLETTPRVTDGYNNRSTWRHDVTFCICSS